MDLKVLLAKLDKLDQRQILTESAAMVEEVLSAELELLKESYIALMERVRGKELEALRGIKDEEQRKKQIAIMAVKNNYPGLFDPVTGKWVDYKGNYAWFGPYKAEVEQMEKDGLVPPEAHTSAFWGLMGKDEREAYAASLENRSKYDLVDDAGDIIDKANKSKGVVAETVNKGTLARALTENFGYSFKYINESIDEKEHNTLKAIIEKLNDNKYKDDPEVQAILKKYQEYVLYRDQLIAKIKQALAELKGKMPQAKPLAESRSALKEEIYLIPHSDNTVSAVHFYLNENGDIVEYVITEDVEALGRGLLSGITFGWGDNAVAYMISLYKGTPYGEELMKQLKATDAAKERSPVWYWGGNLVGGSMIIPGGGGVVANLAKGGIAMAAQTGSDKFLREPHNAKYQQQAAKKGSQQTPADANAVKKVQQSTGQNPTGQMDATSAAAVRNKGAQVVGTTSSSEAGTDMQDIFATAGVKDLNGLISVLKKAGADTYDKVGQVLANMLKIDSAPTTTSESIIYSSMSESERMAYLRNRLVKLDADQLNEAGITWQGFIQGLEKLSGGAIKSAETKAVQALEKLYGGPNAKFFLSSGEKFEAQAGSPGKWVDVSGKNPGKSFSSEEVLQMAQADVQAGKLIPSTINPKTGSARPASTAPVTPLDTENMIVQVGNANYVKTGGVWHKVGERGKVDPTLAKKLEKEAQAKAQAKAQSSTQTSTTPSKPPTSSTTPTPHTSPTVPPSSPAAAATLAEKLAAQYPKTAAVLKGMNSVAKYGWSKKWWIAMAAVITAGYLSTKTEPEPPTPPGPNGPENVVTDPTVPVNGKCTTPGYKLSADGKTCEKIQSSQEVAPVGPTINNVPVSPEQLATIQKYAGNIKAMMKQLEDMYPADKETKDMRSEVDEVLKGIPESTQSSQQVQQSQQAKGTSPTISKPGARPISGDYSSVGSGMPGNTNNGTF